MALFLIEASCGSATLQPPDGGGSGGRSGTGGGAQGGTTGAGGAAGAKGTAGTTGGAGAAGHEGGVDAGRDMGPVKQPNGHACSAATDCSSGFCAQNVCCSTACTDTCYACTNALTGASPDGTCAVVSSGLADPAGGCAAGAATSCGNTGHCDGKGACEKFGSTTTCKAASCGSGGFTPASTCDGKGNCAAGTTVDCTGFTCSAATGCATTCTADGDCPGGYCTSTMTCATTLSDGSTCTKNSQCAHANCIAGICCATACAGTCMTCASGLCKPVAAGGSSAGLCAVDTTACGHDGTCDGNGGCRYQTTSVTCGAVSCNSGLLTPTGKCNGAGACSQPAAGACPGGVVCASATACKSATCATDTDCASGFCLGGTCTGKYGNGASCTATDQCSTGNCVDGVCCNTGCTGTCAYCGGIPSSGTPAGTCGVVSGAPKRGSCAGTGMCQGSCNGTATSCVMPGSTVMCGSPSCNASTETSTAASFCDGQGNCPSGATNPCNPYVCGSTACVTSCSGSGAGQCASTAACISGSCQTCSSGRSACGTVCADETSDPNHCGSCTIACSGTTPLCVSKKCVQCSALTDCKAGYYACTNNSCVCRQQSSKNLAPSAGFDTGITGWTSEENMASWSAMDADGCPSSGSITAPDGDVLVACIQNVQPNTAYYFGLRYLQAQANGVYCFITWMKDTTCQYGGSRFSVQSGSTTGAWSSTANTATSDTGTLSAQVLCQMNGTVNVDQVYLNTVISGF